jgi:hypothetical protein
VRATCSTGCTIWGPQSVPCIAGVLWPKSWRARPSAKRPHRRVQRCDAWTRGSPPSPSPSVGVGACACFARFGAASCRRCAWNTACPTGVGLGVDHTARVCARTSGRDRRVACESICARVVERRRAQRPPVAAVSPSLRLAPGVAQGLDDDPQRRAPTCRRNDRRRTMLRRPTRRLVRVPRHGDRPTTAARHRRA